MATDAKKAKAVQSEVEKRKYPMAAQYFQKCADKLASKTDALQRTNGRMASAREEVKELQQLKLPKSCRPFNLSYDRLYGALAGFACVIRHPRGHKC